MIGLFIGLVLATTCKSQALPFTHGWDTVGDLIFAHGSSSTPGGVSEKALNFLADEYKIVTFGNCYGGWPLETTVLDSVKTMKKHNSNVKGILYWKSDMIVQVKKCSNQNATFAQHPEWILHDDYGNIVSPRQPYFDLLNPSLRDWMTNHLLSLANVTDDSGNRLLSGFFLDGVENSPNRTSTFANVSAARYEALLDAKFSMLVQLQQELTRYGQVVITNALDTTWQLEKVTEIGASMIDHFAILQFIDKVTGEMLPGPMKELLFDVARSPTLANRTVEIKGWPGPIIRQRDVWPNNSQPTTPSEFQQAALDYMNNALSYFLLVAEENTWWGYSWFWGMGDVEPFEQNSTVPSSFFPIYKCPLGPPQGPPKQVDTWKFERQYQYASVAVDLESRNNSKVVFHSCDTTH